jgi:hypothetical protein
LEPTKGFDRQLDLRGRDIGMMKWEVLVSFFLKKISTPVSSSDIFTCQHKSKVVAMLFKLFTRISFIKSSIKYSLSIYRWELN